MSLFRLIAKLGIDSTEFNAGLKQSESMVGASMKRIGGLVAGAFSVSAVAAFANSVSKAAGQIADMADQLGISTDQFQALQRASDLSGVSLEKYVNALGKLRKLKADAKSGDASANATFSSTGLNPNADEFTLLQQIGGLPDEKAFEILDARSAKLKNSLKDINSVPKIELMTAENVQILDRAGDSLGNMMRSLKALASIPLAGVAQAILDGSWVRSEPFVRNAPLPLPSRIRPRSTGEEFGPTDGEATVQMLNRARQSGSGQFSTMEDLIRGSKFTPINMGDRSNVGGFFGPNAGLNSRLSRLGTNVEKMTKAMEEVRDALKVQSN